MVECERVDNEQKVQMVVRERCQEPSMRQIAALAGVHDPHLTEVLVGQRKTWTGDTDKVEGDGIGATSSFSIQCD